MDGREFSVEQLDAMHHPCCEGHEDQTPVDCREDGDPWPCPWEERRREVVDLRAQLDAWRPVVEAAKEASLHMYGGWPDWTGALDRAVALLKQQEAEEAE